MPGTVGQYPGDGVKGADFLCGQLQVMLHVNASPPEGFYAFAASRQLLSPAQILD